MNPEELRFTYTVTDAEIDELLSEHEDAERHQQNIERERILISHKLRREGLLPHAFMEPLDTIEQLHDAIYTEREIIHEMSIAAASIREVASYNRDDAPSVRQAFFAYLIGVRGYSAEDRLITFLNDQLPGGGPSELEGETFDEFVSSARAEAALKQQEFEVFIERTNSLTVELINATEYPLGLRQFFNENNHGRFHALAGTCLEIARATKNPHNRLELILEALRESGHDFNWNHVETRIMLILNSYYPSERAEDIAQFGPRMLQDDEPHLRPKQPPKAWPDKGRYTEDDE